MVTLKKKLIYPFLAIMGVIAFGTAGYMFVEGWNFLDALYMTVITLTTVGYEEVHNLSDAGRLFSITLMLSGVGAMFYALGVGARVLLEGELRAVLGRKRLSKKIEHLKDHYIVCGYGRMGRIICNELRDHRSPFVVIEGAPDVVATLDKDILVLQGDATQDSVLKEAGIERASGLISVLASDADNLYVVLSSRGLNHNLTIVARAGDEGAEHKLKRAGADRVISPYLIGGVRIAQTLLKPTVVDFIEFATRSGNLELQMEEIRIRDDSKLIDCSLDKCGIRKDLGVIIVAIKRASGEMEFNPRSATVIKQGDTIVALGEVKDLKALDEMTG